MHGDSLTQHILTPEHLISFIPLIIVTMSHDQIRLMSHDKIRLMSHDQITPY